MPPISLQKTYRSLTAKVCANAFFDQRCNELERWFHKRGYSERFVSQKILKARKMPRNELLEKECNHLYHLTPHSKILIVFILRRILRLDEYYDFKITTTV